MPSRFGNPRSLTVTRHVKNMKRTAHKRVNFKYKLTNVSTAQTLSSEDDFYDHPTMLLYHDTANTNSNSSRKDLNRERLICVCRTPFNSRRFMIMCQNCSKWFHGTCVGISKADMTRLVYYVCLECEDMSPVQLNAHPPRNHESLLLETSTQPAKNSSDILPMPMESFEHESTTIEDLSSMNPSLSTNPTESASFNEISLETKPVMASHENGICPICDDECICGKAVLQPDIPHRDIHHLPVVSSLQDDSSSPDLKMNHPPFSNEFYIETSSNQTDTFPVREMNQTAPEDRMTASSSIGLNQTLVKESSRKSSSPASRLVNRIVVPNLKLLPTSSLAHHHSQFKSTTLSSTHRKLTKRRFNPISSKSSSILPKNPHLHYTTQNTISGSGNQDLKRQRLLPMRLLLNGLQVQTSLSLFPFLSHEDSVDDYENQTAPSSPQSGFIGELVPISASTAPCSPTHSLPLISPSIGVNVQSLFTDYFDSLSFVRVSNEYSSLIQDKLDHLSLSDRF